MLNYYESIDLNLCLACAIRDCDTVQIYALFKHF